MSSAPTACRPALSTTLQVFIIAIVALISRITQLDRPPGLDELFIYNAAIGWMETGTPSILDGLYTRASVVTAAISGLFQLSDSTSLVLSRAPSAIFGVALVLSVFFWSDRFGNRRIAWIAATLLIIYPTSLYLSQILRYYSILAFFFVNSIFLFYTALLTKKWRLKRIFLISIATLFTLISIYLQKVSIIGYAFFAIWCTAILYTEHRKTINIALGNKPVVVSALAALALSAILLAPMMPGLFRTFTYSPPWLSGSRPATFYASHFLHLYPLLTIAYLPALYFCIRSYPKLASMCSAIFMGTILTQSFAGMKDPRYIYYAAPFFFISSAIILDITSNNVYHLIRRAIQRLQPGIVSAKFSRYIHAAILALLSIIIIATTPVRDSFYFFRHGFGPNPTGGTFWNLAAELTEPDTSDGPIIVTDADMHTIYYLGTFDVHFSPEALDLLAWHSNVDGAPDFYTDFRTGRPTIGSVAALANILDCHKETIILASRSLADKNRQYRQELQELLDDPNLNAETQYIGASLIVRLPEVDQPEGPTCPALRPKR